MKTLITLEPRFAFGSNFEYIFLAHFSRRLVGELIVYPWSGVRPSSSTISNIIIFATSGPITINFHQIHHWAGGKAALGFGPDSIKTLVTTATDSCLRVIKEKTVLPPILSIRAGNDDMDGSSEGFEIQPDQTTGCGVTCP